MKGYFSSSERRGILVVAALALLITGGGVILSYCGKPDAGLTPLEVEVLLLPDSISVKSHSDSLRKKKKGKRDKKKVEKSKQKAERKTYPKRSPLDEVIPDN